MNEEQQAFITNLAKEIERTRTELEKIPLFLRYVSLQQTLQTYKICDSNQQPMTVDFVPDDAVPAEFNPPPTGVLPEQQEKARLKEINRVNATLRVKKLNRASRAVLTNCVRGILSDHYNNNRHSVELTGLTVFAIQHRLLLNHYAKVDLDKIQTVLNKLEADKVVAKIRRHDDVTYLIWDQAHVMVDRESAESVIVSENLPERILAVLRQHGNRHGMLTMPLLTAVNQNSDRQYSARQLLSALGSLVARKLAGCKSNKTSRGLIKTWYAVREKEAPKPSSLPMTPARVLAVLQDCVHGLKVHEIHRKIHSLHPKEHTNPQINSALALLRKRDFVFSVPDSSDPTVNIWCPRSRGAEVPAAVPEKPKTRYVPPAPVRDEILAVLANAPNKKLGLKADVILSEVQMKYPQVGKRTVSSVLSRLRRKNLVHYEFGLTGTAGFWSKVNEQA